VVLRQHRNVARRAPHPGHPRVSTYPLVLLESARVQPPLLANVDCPLRVLAFVEHGLIYIAPIATTSLCCHPARPPINSSRCQISALLLLTLLTSPFPSLSFALAWRCSFSGQPRTAVAPTARSCKQAAATYTQTRTHVPNLILVRPTSLAMTALSAASLTMANPFAPRKRVILQSPLSRLGPRGGCRSE
jgi:hypothetical protein